MCSAITPSATATLGEHDPRTPEGKRDPDSAERALSLSDYCTDDDDSISDDISDDCSEEDEGGGGEETDASEGEGEGAVRSWKGQTELQRNTRLHPQSIPQTTPPSPPPITRPDRTIYTFMPLL